jgi:hypothetical protein
MGGMMFMDSPVQDGEGWYVGYGICGPQTLGPSGFLAPTKIIKEETNLTIAGVDVDLIPVVGETPDVLFVWLPQKEVLIQIAIVYEAFPAIWLTFSFPLVTGLGPWIATRYSGLSPLAIFRLLT